MASAATSSRLGLPPWRISRDAAESRSLRVRSRCWGRPLKSSAISGLRQLAKDGGHVHPHVLARYLAALGEFHHMQQPELERPAAPLYAEWPPRRRAIPHRLVDDEVRPAQSAQAAHAALGQVGEKLLVEATRTFPSARGSRRGTHDVVLHVGRK